MVGVLSGDVGEVLVATFGHEVRLGDDGQSALAQRADQLDGDHRAVLDAVARPDPDVVERGDGHDELAAGHAVHGDRPTEAAGGAEAAGELVRCRQPGVVEQELDRTASQLVAGAGGQAGPPGHDDVERERTVALSGRQQLDLRRILGRGEVRHGRHAVAGELPTDGRQVGSGESLRPDAGP